ncbi:DUF3137 domain-containing protein [Nisaea sp.]|uniref:DUF3137 domain-containing protein n=1 Tax=Nisaea sp. TaxID=2024842 RepID=UPI002B272A0F|nr:DUF3137 domain-containing protein [Nisaea sp.]
MKPEAPSEPSLTEGEDANSAELERLRQEFAGWERKRQRYGTIAAALFYTFIGCIILPLLGGFAGILSGGIAVFFMALAGCCFLGIKLLIHILPKDPFRRVKKYILKHLGYRYSKDAQRFPFRQFERLYLLSEHLRYKASDIVEGDFAGVKAMACKAKNFQESRKGDRLEVRGNQANLLNVLHAASRSSGKFEGGLIVAEFPKPFQGQTAVLPKDLQPHSLLSGLFQGVGERVELESEDFNDSFLAYSTDQVEARYLLTPSMIDRILRLRSIFRAEVGIGFSGGKIHIAMNDGREWFVDPGMGREVTDPAYLDDIREDLEYVGAILRELNLGASSRV